AAHVRIEHIAHVVVLERRELVVADDARVVDQDVDPTAALGDAVDGSSARGGIAYVDLLRGDLLLRGPRGVDDGRGRVGVTAIEQRDVATLVGGTVDDRAPAAPASAGHDHALAVEPGTDLHRRLIPRSRNRRRRSA